MTKNEFIKDAIQIHGNKFIYEKLPDIINLSEKVCIICPKHGEFWQDYTHHIKRKQGCRLCANEQSSKRQSMGKDEFIKKSKEIHGDKYDYSKVEYVNQNTKVCIICPIHGEFWQKPNNHLSGKGCHYCRGKNISKSKSLGQEEFLRRAKEVHGNKYNYSKAVYKNLKTNIEIICPEHGSFFQSPDMHIGRGEGCPLCARKKLASLQFITFEEFLKKAREVHGNEYEYCEDTYNGVSEKVDIICKKHGKFSQLGFNHIRGQGCPVCKMSKLERSIQLYLDSKNIKYEKQKTFNWLTNIFNLKLDFYLPEYNVAIECQGIQHYIPSNLFGGKDGFEHGQKLDKLKLELCNKHNIKIYYYSNLDIEYPYFTYVNKEDMLNDIIKENKFTNI